MAVIFTEERKKQKKLIYILFAVLLVTGLVLWQGILKKSPEKMQGLPTSGALQAGAGKAEINFETLENPIFEELQSFNKIEPFKEKIGRENPFLPY